ncbi:MAG: alginate export family protein [Tannerellaceae bacterium]|nr:alginate export family protein [Tannerellaceae bacterium]
MKNRIFILLVSAIVFTNAYSQVKIEGEVRSRSELNSGTEAPLTEEQNRAFVTVLRSRLNVIYSQEKVIAKVTVQDTRTFGSVAPGTLATNTTGLYEAWGEYAFTGTFSARLGRQILEYDDKRLFSASNWSNTGNAHDVLLLDYHTDDLRINLVGGWNNPGDNKFERLYDVDKSYKSLLLFWLSKQAGIVNITPVYVNESFQYEHAEGEDFYRHYRNTLGGNILLKEKNSPFSVYATAYYQFGRDNKQNKLNASLLALRADYTIRPSVAVLAGVDYYSGSRNDLAPGYSHTFNKLYGSNHNFNGSMEYWKNPPVQGLWDIYAGVTVRPLRALKINGTFHSFSLVKEHVAIDKKGLGSEFDLTIDYQLAPQVAIQGGWSAYFTTHTTKVVKGVNDTDIKFPQWAYIQVGFKF